MTQQSATTILSYVVDQSTVNQAVAANQSVALTYVEMTQAANALGITLQEFQDLSGLQISSANQQTTANTQLAQSYTQVAQSANQAASAQQSAGGGINFGGARSALRAGGFLLGSEAGGGSLRALGQVATLTNVLGPLGVVAAAGAIAFRALGDETKRETDLITAQIDTQREAATVIAKSTRDALTQARDAAVILLAQQKQELDRVSNTPITVNANTLLGLLTQGAIGGGEAAGVNTELEKQKALIAATTTNITEYNAALAANATITNDATAAVRKELELDKTTQEERDKRMAQIQRELSLLDSHIEKNDVSIDVQQQLLPQIDALNTEYQQLAGVTTTYGDTLKAVSDQLSVISDSTTYHAQLEADARKATVDQETDRIYSLKEEAAAIATYLPELERLAPTSSEAAKALSDAQTRLTRIGEDFQDIVTQVLPAAVARLNQKLAEDSAAVVNDANSAIFKARSDEAAKITDLESAAGDRRTEIIQNTEDAIAKLTRDSGRELATDVGNRDAAAFAQAKQKAADAMVDQQTQEDKQVALVAANLAKQEATTLKSELAQEDTIRTGEDQKLDVLNEATAKQLNDLNASLTAVTVLHQQGGYQVENVVNTHWSNLYTITSNWANAISDAVTFSLNRSLAALGVSLPPVTGTAALNQAIDARINHTLYGGLSSGNGASAG